MTSIDNVRDWLHLGRAEITSRRDETIVAPVPAAAAAPIMTAPVVEAPAATPATAPVADMAADAKAQSA